ncbi:MAG TPA: CBS domain-containing protein [Candidatus Binatia bacterium]|jgi:CBS domain-containing protein|nr:CBS domain-containing protein [Candidatus Binatia bacterium]
MSLQKFCERSVVTISPEQNIVEACGLMREKNVGCLVAVEGEKLRGILTDRDIALKVTAEKKDPQQTKVRDIMTANPTRIAVSKTLHDLTALMHSHHVRRVPIVDGGDKVMGIITLDDLLIVLGQELADIGQGVSGALFRQPEPAGEEEASMPLQWLMSYL